MVVKLILLIDDYLLSLLVVLLELNIIYLLGIFFEGDICVYVNMKLVNIDILFDNLMNLSFWVKYLDVEFVLDVKEEVMVWFMLFYL